jgi:hypothetical protein
MKHKHHILLDKDYSNTIEWFKNNRPLSEVTRFRLYYRYTLEQLETYPYRSRSLSTFHFFDEILNDDYFRYLKLGKHTSYCLFNYPKGKNYILACMSLNLNNLASSLQNRERTKEVV